MQEFEDPVMTVTDYFGHVYQVLMVVDLGDIYKDITTVIDLGMIRIDTEGRELYPVTLGDTNPDLGEYLLCIGNPMGLRYSVSLGVVSRVAPFPDSPDSVLVLQSDVATNPGNSGCPVFGLDGKVYGVCSFVWQGYPGLNFCVPISVVQDHLQEMIDILTRDGILHILEK
jgi:S1-C subfamily serine protease